MPTNSMPVLWYWNVYGWLGWSFRQGQPEGVKLWDGTTGKVVHNLVGHTNWVVALDFTDDGRTLASGAGDSTVMIWDVITGKKVQGLNTGSRFNSTYTYVVQFSPDGSSLACGH